MGKNLCGGLFFTNPVCKNGNDFFRHGIKPAGTHRFFYAKHHDRNGLCIIIYTVLGGMEAVIWTEVVQGIIKTLGALLILYLVIKQIPGGFTKVMEIAKADNKFSLGSAAFNFTQPTFWVVLLYGFFINLNNFGMDQNYIQRYHTAASEKQASKSVWLCVVMYVPVSLLFVIIGTSLYSFYQTQPDLIDPVKIKLATEKLGALASSQQIQELGSYI